jgi:DNA-directed RNA polymerase specialized sigma24 family protein
MFDNDVRSSIRAKIRPFPRVATYPTGWAGQRTFEQIYDDLIPSFNRLLRYYRNHEMDIPDLIAHAFMRLWMDISADTSMLASVDKGGALKLLLNRTNPQLYRKFYRREMYLEDIATRSGDPDDFIIDGFDHSHIIGHATYAEAIELRVDIEKVITEMAEKYMDSLPHLAALYYITTEVGPDDAAAIAGRSGTKKCWWLTSVVKPMREELCEKLELFKPRQQTWRDRHLAGVEAPLLCLVARYEAEGNLRMAGTVQSMGAYESCKTLVERLGLSKYTIHMLRRNAHKELNRVYGCAP